MEIENIRDTATEGETYQSTVSRRWTVWLHPEFSQHLWAESYLAAFAMSVSCRVVSLGSDFKRFDGIGFLHLES